MSASIMEFMVFGMDSLAKDGLARGGMDATIAVDIGFGQEARPRCWIVKVDVGKHSRRLISVAWGEDSTRQLVAWWNGSIMDLIVIAGTMNYGAFSGF